MEKFSDNIKKVILAGIGAVATTAERSKDLLDEMGRRRGQRIFSTRWLRRAN